MIITTLIYVFSLECLHTGYRYVNMEKYESKYEMLNKVAAEYGDGFAKPRNAFFTPREADDLHSLTQEIREIQLGQVSPKIGWV